MKRNISKFVLLYWLICLCLISVPSYAFGTLIVMAVLHVAELTFAQMLVAAAINIAVSYVLAKASMPDVGGLAGNSPNPGNRVTIPPQTDNKLPIIYGSAWCGGTIVDMSITDDNQTMYYVVAICEVTNTNTLSDTPDPITIGDIYWGGKKCNFNQVQNKAFGTEVLSLTDQSDGTVDDKCSGKISMYLYTNGSNSGFNTDLTAVQVMQDANCSYKWDGTHSMTNTCFAIIKLTYSTSASITSLAQIKFKINNINKSPPAAAFLDYLTNTRYGAGIPLSQVDTTSLNYLRTYAQEIINYTSGNSLSLNRINDWGTGTANWYSYCGNTTNITYGIAPDNSGRAMLNIVRNTGNTCGASTAFGMLWANANNVFYSVNEEFTVRVWARVTNASTATMNIGLDDSNMQSFTITNTWQQYTAVFASVATPTNYRGFQFTIAPPATGTLNVSLYGAETMSGSPAGQARTIQRFQFNGVLDTSRSVMQNLQEMCNSCDTLLRYNEVTGKWGLIVQNSAYVVAMNLDDSNLTSAITVSPLDISNNYNIIEAKYVDSRTQDSFNVMTVNLAVENPSLLYPNEPVNKMTCTLSLVNNDVRAKMIANRLMKAARLDLQVTCSINFTGIQLEAGDVVQLSNVNYGFTNKLFRLNKVTESIQDNGAMSVHLIMSEYDPQVYSDSTIAQLDMPVRSGLGDPLQFGQILKPTLYDAGTFQNAAQPVLAVQITAASSGITQYMEVWYSASANPTSTDQMYFAATSDIKPSGLPYALNEAAVVSMVGIKAGTWYFFSRMVNGLVKSSFSPHSNAVFWRPYTFNFFKRYLAVAYADDANGSNIAFNPTNKTYFGIYEQDNEDPPAGYNKPNPQAFANNYTWYLSIEGTQPMGFQNRAASGQAALPLKNLIYCTRGARTISFGTTSCNFYNNGGGPYAFSPAYDTQSVYDPSIWSGLPYEDGTHTSQLGYRVIDLDRRSGQSIQTATTTNGPNDGALTVTTNDKGQLQVSLPAFLAGQAAFANGVTQTTGSATLLNYDVYGRVVSLKTPDALYYTKQEWIFSSGSQTFTPAARNASYIAGQDLIFRNGVLLRPNSTTTYDYSETATTFTINGTLAANEIITCISFRSVTQEGGTATYATFTRNYYTMSGTTELKPTTLKNGFELIFLNGAAWNDNDYDIDEAIGTIKAVSIVTGDVCLIQWAADHATSLPSGGCNNTAVYTTPVGGSYLQNYNYTYDTNAFNLYINGVLLKNTADYTATSGTTYSLVNAPQSDQTIILQQKFNRTGAA